MSELMMAFSGPGFAGGALAFAPTGRCPIGPNVRVDGLGSLKAWLGVGCAAAAAPSQGSAVAGDATPTAAMRPMAVADATSIEAYRWRGDMSHLSRAGRERQQSSAGADVTIVIAVTVVINDQGIGMDP